MASENISPAVQALVNEYGLDLTVSADREFLETILKTMPVAPTPSTEAEAGPLTKRIAANNKEAEAKPPPPFASGKVISGGS